MRYAIHTEAYMFIISRNVVNARDWQWKAYNVESFNLHCAVLVYKNEYPFEGFCEYGLKIKDFYRLKIKHFNNADESIEFAQMVNRYMHQSCGYGGLN
jgi:hypothetical protein